jgi:hypothetical protein
MNIRSVAVSILVPKIVTNRAKIDKSEYGVTRVSSFETGLETELNDRKESSLEYESTNRLSMIDIVWLIGVAVAFTDCPRTSSPKLSERFGRAQAMLTLHSLALVYAKEPICFSKAIIIGRNVNVE